MWSNVVRWKVDSSGPNWTELGPSVETEFGRTDLVMKDGKIAKLLPNQSKSGRQSNTNFDCVLLVINHTSRSHSITYSRWDSVPHSRGSHSTPHSRRPNSILHSRPHSGPHFIPHPTLQTHSISHSFHHPRPHSFHHPRPTLHPILFTALDPTP